MSAHVPLLIAMMACQGDEGGPGPPAPPEPEPEPPIVLTDQVRAMAEAEGFSVGEGLFSTSTFEHCCDADANCLGNNPSTPYGMIALPPAPDALVPDLDTFWMWGTLPKTGMSRAFRLRPDEAYVWIGRSPPRSKYWSYRGSIASRENDDGQRNLVLGSLGPSLNQLAVAQQRGVSPDEVWDTEMAIVTSSDELIEQQVDEWLVAAGLPRQNIHHDRLSAADARFGLETPADTFMGIMRVAVPDDADALAAWQASPPVRVLRLTPPVPMSRLPMARQPLPERGSGQDESAWVPALVELARAVRERWPALEPKDLPMRPSAVHTYECIYEGSCIGDTSDRYAARIDYTALPDDDAFVVVFGINHERTGRAVYSNVALMTFDNYVGVAAIDSAQMVGSARAWLGDDHPQVDDLFAWVFSRDCSKFDLPCLEVEDECPWPERHESFYITSRVYLDPATGTAPRDSEMVLDRVWEYRP